MKAFLIGWEAVDQTVGCWALVVLGCVYIGWILFGEHKTGGRR